MKRLQLVELEDLPWFPKVIRDPSTDHIRYFAEVLNIYAPAEKILTGVLEKTGHSTCIDLCSGGGGALVSLREKVSKRLGRPVQCVLTDRYPNLPAFESAEKESNGAVKFIAVSVDATHVPENLKGVRTIFSALHHFPPKLVKAIFNDAEKNGAPLCVFEATERTVYTTFSILFVALGVLLFAPFIRPFSWSRIFWTYVIPLVPLLVLFDGTVSCLRTYKPEEMLEMAREISTNKNYKWTAGKIKRSGILTGVNMTYLVGCS